MAINNPPGNAMQTLLQLMSMLRDPQHGCPWDLKQSFASIAPHTLEEVYEVVDAIETNDMQQLKEELGDLLFQVVFYAQLGKEQHLFDFETIAKTITTKLLQRHPHVFPSATLESFGQVSDISSEQVVNNWEQIKTQERKQKKSTKLVSALDDVPIALPSMLRATKLQKRVSNVGFDWQSVHPVYAKVKEELSELEVAMETGNNLHVEEEFGDLLFSMVNLSRHLHLDSEASLRKANRKFEARFRSVERMVVETERAITDLSAAEMDMYWERAKNIESKK